MRNFLITCTVFLLMVSLGFSDDLIDMGSSNQSVSTSGFEQNYYDYLLDPSYFNLIESSTIFFTLDGDASQFGTGEVGTGFRGGYAWIREGFSPLFALNYTTYSSTDSEIEENNITYDYNNFDTASGTYASIDEDVNISSTKNPRHKLMAHFGGKLDGSINFDVQALWEMDRATGSNKSFTNIYTDTVSASDASLDTKGNLIETTYNLINDDNVIAIEPEIGLSLEGITSTIGMGIALYNPGAADDNYSSTTTSYGGGIDPTVIDQTTVNSYTGSYYGSSANTCFDMDTSNPINTQRILANFNSTTIVAITEGLEVEIPLYYDMTFYPALTTIDNTIITGFNDASTELLEISRTENIISTSLDVNTDINWGIGGTLKKTFNPSENSSFYIGADLGFSMKMDKNTRSRTRINHTQTDGDADGLYTTAGTDLDTTTSLSGYEIQTKKNIYVIGLGIPVAVSYSPVNRLTFHAGTATTMTVTLTNTETLTTGSSSYLYETYTDNLTAANSYEQRQKDATNNENTPYSNFTSSFGFGATGSFGFTLDISDKFQIDAVATGNSSMSIDSFSLTGSYAY